MTSKEFVLWLKGFTDGVHEFNITPKQWDYLKQKLSEVDDNTIPMGGLLNDHNRFGTAITTTPGTTGHITISNPNIASFGTGSVGTITTNSPSTSITYGYPSGSTWSYTKSNDKIL